ncbi:MAG: YraN family protein [Planctomycetales bacterium]|nr:YraN family protein [Planctomycetales bacterium]
MLSLTSQWLADRLAAKPLGYRGEELAARHLKKRGYVIVAKRLRGRFGEIDLIAVDDKTVVFVEVKTRRSRRTGHPSDVIDAAKIRRMTRAALVFLKRHGLTEYPARFDVVAITWPRSVRRPEIEHFQNVFEADLTGHEMS